ncbi:hypothetical protein BD410DRAFT_901408 [Rickenella mellea]|uniref:Xylanolytic transcriptional activator regulatory domain-containing protein n=1 Tax=Rickenella mellea TaxID=50990 RepID=A0A4Y7PQ74_9AGAM|nr:hypothetical protein BD410DRAFT_901408 [Rickenella mellea]
MATTQDSRLTRGKACISCRRRKMVSYFTSADEGTITEVNGRDVMVEGLTRTELLEANVARLEARLKQLEIPIETGPVILHDPHARHRDEPQAPPVTGNFVGGSSTPGPSHFVGTRPLNTLSSSSDEFEPQLSALLVNIVQPFAHQIGLALYSQGFNHMFEQSPLHPSYPVPSLLNSIYIWALRLSNLDDFIKLEPQYVTKTTLALTEAVGSRDSKTRLHTLQAEVLIANYFFCMGRTVEARYHASAAITMALSCGLHQLTGRNTPPNLSLVGSARIQPLAPARDGIEQRERVNLFWAVFILDKCWSTAVNSPSMLCEEGESGVQITTPWSVDNNGEGSAGFDEENQTTVRWFLSGRLSEHGWRSSTVATRAKGSALFECAARITKPSSIQTNLAGINTLMRVSSEYLGSFPNPTQLAHLSPDIKATIIVSRSLAFAAQIDIYRTRARSDQISRSACISCARAIVNMMELIEQDHLGFIDPVVTSVWMKAATVLTREHAHQQILGQGPSSKSSRDSPHGDATKMTALLEQMVDKFPMLTSRIQTIIDILRSVS